MAESLQAVRDYLAARQSKPTAEEVQAFNEGCYCAFFAMHAYIDSLPAGHPAVEEFDRAAEQAKRARIPWNKPKDPNHD